MQKEEITEAELLNYIKKSDSIKLDEIRIEYEMKYGEVKMENGILIFQMKKKGEF